MNDRGICPDANTIESAESAEFFTKHGNYPVKRINDFEFVVQKDLFMASDHTIGQAANVTTLPGVIGHVAVLPDGHEGYGFPVGGVAATDLEEGVISPGGVGYDINCESD